MVAFSILISCCTISDSIEVTFVNKTQNIVDGIFYSVDGDSGFSENILDVPVLNPGDIYAYALPPGIYVFGIRFADSLLISSDKITLEDLDVFNFTIQE